MDDSQDRSKATAHEHQSSTSKKNFQSEVRILLQQLSSWREESNRQFTNIIDSHASTIRAPPALTTHPKPVSYTHLRAHET